MAEVPAARRARAASSWFSAVCTASALVPLVGNAPLAVTIFWLLAIPPVVYAGLWVTLAVVGVMWLTGWRPQEPH